MNFNNFRFLFFVFLIISILLFFIFIAIFILKEFLINSFLLKGNTSRIFLLQKIRINDKFFKTFNKKQRRVFTFLFMFLILNILNFLLWITFSLIYFLNIKNPLYFDIDKLILFSTILSIVFIITAILFILIYIIKISKIGKEFKKWRTINSNLEGQFFEKISTKINKENNELIKKFCFLEYLNITLIDKLYYFKWPFNTRKIRWKKEKSKLKLSKRDEEFYYFLIFNYEDVAIDNTIFKIEDYSYIYQNRDKIFSYNKKTGE